MCQKVYCTICSMVVYNIYIINILCQHMVVKIVLVETRRNNKKYKFLTHFNETQGHS